MRPPIADPVQGGGDSAGSAERWASLLRATLEATADGILVVGRDGGLVAYNQRFLQLWSIPADLARHGRNQTLILHVVDQLCDPDTFLDITRRSQADPEGEYPLSLRFKDGRVLERSSRPQWLGNEIAARVLTFRDLSEKERLLEQAQQAVQLRDRSLSIAAHEIRTPIASIRLAVQALRTSALPAEVVAQSLDIIDRGQRRLANLVEKLLDLGRVRAGVLKLDLEPTDLVEVAREVIARHQVELQRCGSAVCLQASEPVVGSWDRLRLDQVVTNLLANAIKFGSGRPIELVIGEERGDGVLRVRDQGIGIPADVQPHIFQAFQRGVPSRHFDGLGLGLHIVQTIVEALGGEVQVASPPGAGTTFTVRLPRTLAAESDGLPGVGD